MSIGREYRRSATAETEPGVIRRRNFSDDGTRRRPRQTPVRNGAEDGRQKGNDGHRPVQQLTPSSFNGSVIACCRAGCPTLGNPPQLGRQIARVLPPVL